MRNTSTLPVIHSIGTAVPKFRIEQENHRSILESANGRNRVERLMLNKVFHKSGISSRYSVLEEFGREDLPSNLIFHPEKKIGPTSISKRMELFEKHAPLLCAAAVRDCFRNDLFMLSKVTHLITFSCTGMSAPGIDISLIEELKLDRSVERTCINFMGCYAGINALRMAGYIARSQPGANVLVAGVEICTIHYQEIQTNDQLIANALFADGASAALVTSGLNSDRDHIGLAMSMFHSEFEPSGINEMAWRIGDFGFDIRLSTYVPDLIRDNITRLLQKLFLKSGIDRKAIDWFAIHPGGVKILEACEKALGISPEENRKAYETLNEFGNMSSVTVFFVLKKYFDALRAQDRGKKILSCAFGPGLTMESMLLDVC